MLLRTTITAGPGIRFVHWYWIGSLECNSRIHHWEMPLNFVELTHNTYIHTWIVDMEEHFFHIQCRFSPYKYYSWLLHTHYTFSTSLGTAGGLTALLLTGTSTLRDWGIRCFSRNFLCSSSSFLASISACCFCSCIFIWVLYIVTD